MSSIYHILGWFLFLPALHKRLINNLRLWKVATLRALQLMKFHRFLSRGSWLTIKIQLQKVIQGLWWALIKLSYISAWQLCLMLIWKISARAILQVNAFSFVVQSPMILPNLIEEESFWGLLLGFSDFLLLSWESSSSPEYPTENAGLSPDDLVFGEYSVKVKKERGVRHQWKIGITDHSLFSALVLHSHVFSLLFQLLPWTEQQIQAFKIAIVPRDQVLPVSENITISVSFSILTPKDRPRIFYCPHTVILSLTTL